MQYANLDSEEAPGKKEETKKQKDPFDEKVTVAQVIKDQEDTILASVQFGNLLYEYRDNLNSLANMGFNDIEKNLIYLQENDNHLDTVVSQLLEDAEGGEEE